MKPNVPDPAQPEPLAPEPEPTAQPQQGQEKSAAPIVPGPGGPKLWTMNDLKQSYGSPSSSDLAYYQPPKPAKSWVISPDLSVVPLIPTVLENTARDLYSTLDFLMFDQLPDLSEERMWYEPRSHLGELAAGLGEGALLNFGLGAAGLGRGAAALTRMVPGGANVLTALEAQTRLARFTRFALHGMPVDFMMGQHGGGLSNILQGLPSDTLQSIGGILGGHEGDSEGFDRFKATIEGAGVGPVAGPMLGVLWKFLKGLRRANRAQMKVNGAYGETLKRDPYAQLKVEQVARQTSATLPYIEKLREWQLRQMESAPTPEAGTVMGPDGQFVVERHGPGESADTLLTAQERAAKYAEQQQAEEAARPAAELQAHPAVGPEGEFLMSQRPDGETPETIFAAKQRAEEMAGEQNMGPGRRAAVNYMDSLQAWAAERAKARDEIVEAQRAAEHKVGDIDTKADIEQTGPEKLEQLKNEFYNRESSAKSATEKPMPKLEPGGITKLQQTEYKDMGLTNEEVVDEHLKAFESQIPLRKVRDEAGKQSNVPLLFESNLDRAIWISGMKEHPLKAEANKALQELGLSKNEIATRRSILRDMIDMGKREPIPGFVREDPSFARYETGVRVMDSGARDQLVRRSEDSTIKITPETIAEAAAKGKPGVQGFVEEAIASGVHPKFARLLESFGRNFLGNDVTTSRVEGEKGGAYIKNATEYGHDLIMLGDSLEKANFNAAEELIHKIYEVHFPPEAKAEVEALYEKSKEAGKTTDPNAEEYISRAAAREVTGKFARQQFADSPGFTGVAGKVYNTLVDMWHWLVDRLGIDRTRTIARAIINGQLGELPRLDAEGGTTIRFSEEAEPKAEDGVRATMDPEGILQMAKHQYEKTETTPLEAAPYKLSAREKYLTLQRKGFVNTIGSIGSRSAIRFIQMAQWTAHKLGLSEDTAHVEVSEDRLAQEAKDLARAVAAGNDELFMREIAGSPQGIIKEAGLWIHTLHSILTGHAERVGQMVREITDLPAASRTIRQKAEAVQAILFGKDLANAVSLGRSELARQLRWHNPETVLSAETLDKIQRYVSEREQGIPVGESQVEFTPQEQLEAKMALDESRPVSELNDDELKDWVTEKGGVSKIDALLDVHRKMLDSGVNGMELFEKTANAADQFDRIPTVWDFVNSVYSKNLTSGFRTPSAVAASEVGLTVAQPGEHWMGAFVQYMARKWVGDPKAREFYLDQMKEAERTIGFMFSKDEISNAFRAMARAYTTGRGQVMGADLMRSNVGPERFTYDNFEKWVNFQHETLPPALANIVSMDNPFVRGVAWLMTDGADGRGFNWINKLSYVSSRPLVALDDFIKTLVGRSAMRSIIMGRAMKEFPNSPDEWEPFVRRKMDIAFDGEGRILSMRRLQDNGEKIAMTDPEKYGIDAFNPKEVEAFGKQYAAMVSEKNQWMFDPIEFVKYRANEAATTLPADPVTRAWSQFADRAGWPRLITPFISSASSIARTAGHHIDLPGAYRAWRLAKYGDRAVALERAKTQITQELLSGDPRRISEATGRLSAGVLGMTAFGIAASREIAPGLPWITGSLAKDKDIRRIQQKAGLQEYSIYAPGIGYVSYARFDPFASVLGLVADVVTFSKLHPDTERNTMAEVGGSILTAFAHNFQNKTYLMGLSNLMDAMNNENIDGILGVLRRTASSLVIPNIIPQQGAALTGTDDLVRDARHLFFGEFAKKVPYWNESLPLERDVLGDPIRKSKMIDNGFFLPMAYSQVSDNVIDRELLRLGQPFRPPIPDRNGVDLREVFNKDGKQAYDRWGELTGNTRILGLNLREALRKMILSPQYQQIPEKSYPGAESPRVELIRSLISQYREFTYQQVLREYPQVQEAVRRSYMFRQMMREGQTPPVTVQQ